MGQDLVEIPRPLGIAQPLDLARAQRRGGNQHHDLLLLIRLRHLELAQVTPFVLHVGLLEAVEDRILGDAGRIGMVDGDRDFGRAVLAVQLDLGLALEPHPVAVQQQLVQLDSTLSDAHLRLVVLLLPAFEQHAVLLLHLLDLPLVFLGQFAPVLVGL